MPDPAAGKLYPAMMRNAILAVLVIGGAAFIVYGLNPLGGDFVFRAPPGWVQSSSGSAVDPLSKAVSMRFVVLRCVIDVEVNADRLLDYLPAGDRGSRRLVRSKAIARIGGVPVGRVIFDEDGARKLQYFMPDAGRCALVTYTAPVNLFDQNLPTFEASAQSTLGLSSKSPEAGFAARSRLLFLPIMLVIAFCIAVTVLLDRRRQRR
jgi:hypothetical protein